VATIGTRAARERVVAEASPDDVVAGTPAKRVEGALVVPEPPVDPVVPCPAVQLVLTVPSGEDVVPLVAADLILAEPA
jgi:hypothetical protein